MAVETSFLDSLWSGAKDFGSGALGWLKDGSNLKGLGTLAGGIGGAYAAIDQQKQAKAMLDLQKDAYKTEEKRRKDAQLAINGAWGVTPPSAINQPSLNLAV